MRLLFPQSRSLTALKFSHLLQLLIRELGRRSLQERRVVGKQTLFVLATRDAVFRFWVTELTTENVTLLTLRGIFSVDANLRKPQSFRLLTSCYAIEVIVIRALRGIIIQASHCSLMDTP